MIYLKAGTKVIPSPTAIEGLILCSAETAR